MSCKTCNKIRARIRNWLGIDEIITKQGVYFSQYVDAQVKDVVDEIEHINHRLLELTDAGAELEASVSVLDETNVTLHQIANSRHTEQEERLAAIRGLIRDAKFELRKIKDVVDGGDAEISNLAERVQKIEFPGFEAVDYELEIIDDLPIG